LRLRAEREPEDDRGSSIGRMTGSPGSTRAAPTGTIRASRAYTNSRFSALNSGVHADRTRREYPTRPVAADTSVGSTTR
jgi:hypothetical protein